MFPKNTFFASKFSLNCKGKLRIIDKPIIMGILNVTPDSFYDGGRYIEKTILQERIDKMVHEGVDIIDVGGMSSRPGAEIIEIDEELKRILPAIEYCQAVYPETLVSIDTIHAAVAEKAVQAGAHIVNDISGGHYDSKMIPTVAELKVPYIMMHMKGTPETMNSLADYENMISDITSYFVKQVEACREAGIVDIILDPGFGFAKTVDQNFELLSRLGDFRLFDRPILAGLSRKSMIWRTLDIKSDDALNGTSVLNTLALMNGASILRVHDVKEAKETVKLLEKMKAVVQDAH